MKLLFGFVVWLSILMCTHSFAHQPPIVSARGSHWHLEISTKGIERLSINITVSL